MAAPPNEVLAAILESSSTVTRRIEIFESDGVTRFAPTQGTDLRLIDGGVSVDYGRAERRSIDLTLDNADGVLAHNPDGFWYDKIIKAYRGIQYFREMDVPRVLVIDDQLGGERLKTIYRNAGYTDVTYNLSASVLADFNGYDIIVSDMDTSTLTGPRYTLLKEAYDVGYGVITIGANTGASNLPFMISTTVNKSTDDAWYINPYPFDNPLNNGWTTEHQGTTAESWYDLGGDWTDSPDWFGQPTAPVYGKIPTVLTGSAAPAAQWVYGATTYPVIYATDEASGGRWVHFSYPFFGQQAQLLHKGALDWIHNFASVAYWEVALGVFMIDQIKEKHFPTSIQVTGRDQTKACLLAKLSKATGWDVGTSVRSIVLAMLDRSGITTYNVPTTINETLGTAVFYPKGTECWKVISEVCTVFNYEVFFDGDGVFQMRKFRDPLLSPSTMVLRADSQGNLVKYDKSSSDTEIFNKIIATGTSDNGTNNDILVYAELANTEPSSPTRLKVPGVPGGMSERTKLYESAMFTSNQQAMDYCVRWMKILALEEYALDFESLVFAWLEAGDIVEFIDPDEETSEFPTRFLLSGLNIPLSLGPMSGSAKRVTVVGSAA
jgi:hypothetical protein